VSTEQDQARLLAERIARRVSQGATEASASQPRAESTGDVGHELAAVRESLEELQQRLSRLESHLAPRQSNQASEKRQAGTSTTQPATRSPWLSGVYVPASHPSQERFGVEEAAVSELVDFFESEKKCEVEPGGKPCDHCAMCSTRGF
jgi:hypothetical protein